MHGQAQTQEWAEKQRQMQPTVSPPPNPQKKMVLSYPVCHLAKEDSKLMETEAGKNLTKER